MQGVTAFEGIKCGQCGKRRQLEEVVPVGARTKFDQRHCCGKGRTMAGCSSSPIQINRVRLNKSTLLIVVLCLVTENFISALGSGVEINDVQSFLDLTVKSNANADDAVSSETLMDATESVVADGGVKRLWGVADTVATVGKIFHLHIPGDAFAGQIDHYEVAMAGSYQLPRWVRFDAGSSLLEGVPADVDVGQHYITVKAVGSSLGAGEAPSAKDVFSIDVLPAAHDNSRFMPLKTLSSGDDSLQCGPGEAATKVSLAVDADVQQMEPGLRIQMVSRMADYLNLRPDDVQLLPYGKEGRPLDSSTIKAGPGNARQKQTAGAVLQWQIGCGGRLGDELDSKTKKLEASSRDGTLETYLDAPIIGWHISAHTPHRSRREKRQLRIPEPTPVPALLPTHHTAFPDYYPYPDARENEADVDGYGDDVDELELAPESRVVPTMASPIFTEPTYFHPHQQEPSRHPHNNHHRTKTRGRHNHHMTASPAYPHQQNYHQNHNNHHPRPSSIIYGTPVPVPEIFPIHPTESYKVEPTRTFGEEFTAVLPPIIDPPGRIEPSMETTPVAPWLEEVTESLPPSTHEVSPPTPEDVVPTRIVTSHPPRERPRPGTKNSKPIVRSRIKKLPVIAGKVFRFVIPENTFHDDEDGGTQYLKLMLTTKEGTALAPDSWLQFDPVKQMIYGLPLLNKIGKWDFHLEAMDSAGASVKEMVEVRVQQHPLERKVNHEFTLHMVYDTWRFPLDVDWQIQLVEKLASLYKESTNESPQRSNITVQSISKRPSPTFTWTNDSLDKLDKCPEKEINDLLKVLTLDNGSATKRLSTALQPMFRASKITTEWTGSCRGKTTLPTSIVAINRKPKVRNPIDHVLAAVGEFLHFQIPDDTFYDEEDGASRNLKMGLLTLNGEPLPNSSWIHFDTTLHALVGLPMKEELGSHDFRLFATDKEGLDASDAFVVEVKQQPSYHRISVEFSIHIEENYDKFQHNMINKVKVLDKLAHLYGDEDPRYVTVMDIRKGSVVFAWTNRTLPSSPCPKDTIAELKRYLIDEHGNISKQLTQAFLPEFNVSKADAMPMGVCMGDITPTWVTISPPPTKETEHATSDEDLYISTIIPAMVIAAMLLIAAVIACVLYRKKRKGKMTVEDDKTFTGKGIPVILNEEMDDRPDTAKAPMIMKDEKPPLPPPEYPRSTTGSGGPSTPPTDRRDLERSPHPRQHSSHASPHLVQHHRPHLHGSNGANVMGPMDHQPTSESSPLYQPPPPFTTNRDSRMNRPKHTSTPTYRMPPPYVPP